MKYSLTVIEAEVASSGSGRNARLAGRGTHAEIFLTPATRVASRWA